MVSGRAGTGRTGAGRSPGGALAVVLALLCIVAGLVSGRPDTTALAAPFALLALAARTGPRGREEPPVRITSDRRPGAQGARARLLLGPSTGRASGGGLTATILAAPGCPPDGLVLTTGEECPLLVGAPPSGERDVLSYASAGVPADVTGSSSFIAGRPVRLSILPPVGVALARPVARRLLGLAGTHVSRRPGEGVELRSVAPLQPGDALRRIDWRATARRSTDQDRLMVRRSYADAEASVLLVVDPAQDLPSSTADWFATGSPRITSGSLHVARAAATAVAASFLAGGDRVGLDDLSGTRRALRSAGGARHLERIRTRLAGTSVVPRRRRSRDPVPPPGAVVVVFSPFLDDEPARLLRLWHAQGHLVVGVDCVPQLLPGGTTASQAQAVRLTLLRRRLLLEGLREDGIPVLAGTSTATRGGTPGVNSAPAEVAARRAAGAAGADLFAPSGPDLETGLRLLARQAGRRSAGSTRGGARSVGGGTSGVPGRPLRFGDGRSAGAAGAAGGPSGAGAVL